MKYMNILNLNKITFCFPSIFVFIIKKIKALRHKKFKLKQNRICKRKDAENRQIISLYISNMLPNRNLSYRQHSYTSSLSCNIGQTHESNFSVSQASPKLSLFNKSHGVGTMTENKIYQPKILEHLPLGQMILQFNSKKKHRIGHKKNRTHNKGCCINKNQRCQSGLTQIFDITELPFEDQNYEEVGSNKNILQISRLDFVADNSFQAVRTNINESQFSQPQISSKLDIFPNQSMLDDLDCETAAKQGTIQFQRRSKTFESTQKLNFNIETSKSIDLGTDYPMIEDRINTIGEGQAIQKPVNQRPKVEYKNLRKYYVITQQSQTSYQTGSKIIDSRNFDSKQLQNNSYQDNQSQSFLRQNTSNNLYQNKIKDFKKLLKIKPVASNIFEDDFDENKQNKRQKTNTRHSVANSYKYNQQDLQTRVGLPVSLKSSVENQSHEQPLAKIANINNELDLGLKVIDDSFQVEAADEDQCYDPWTLMNLSYLNPRVCQAANQHGLITPINGVCGVILTDQIVLDESIVSPSCHKLRSELQQVLRNDSLATTQQNYSSTGSYSVKANNVLQRIPTLLIPSAGSSTFHSEQITSRYQQRVLVQNLSTQIALLNDNGIITMRSSYKIVCNSQMVRNVDERLQTYREFDHPNIIKVYTSNISKSLQLTCQPPSSTDTKKRIGQTLNVYKQPILLSGLYGMIVNLQDVLQLQENINIDKSSQEFNKLLLIDTNFGDLIKEVIWIISHLSKTSSEIKLNIHDFFVCRIAQNQFTIKVDVSNSAIWQLQEEIIGPADTLKSNINILLAMLNNLIVQSKKSSIFSNKQPLLLNMIRQVQEISQLLEQNESTQLLVWSQLESLIMHPFLNHSHAFHKNHQLNDEFYPLLL